MRSGRDLRARSFTIAGSSFGRACGAVRSCHGTRVCIVAFRYIALICVGGAIGTDCLPRTCELAIATRLCYRSHAAARSVGNSASSDLRRCGHDRGGEKDAGSDDLELERRGHIVAFDGECHGIFTVHSLELSSSPQVASSNVWICKAGSDGSPMTESLRLQSAGHLGEYGGWTILEAGDW